MKLTGETEALILWKIRWENTKSKVIGPEQVQYYENHIKVLFINVFFPNLPVLVSMTLPISSWPLRSMQI